VLDVPDYEAMYKKLFNQVTDAIKLLQESQLATEEIFILSEEEDEEDNEK